MDQLQAEKGRKPINNNKKMEFQDEILKVYAQEDAEEEKEDKEKEDEEDDWSLGEDEEDDAVVDDEIEGDDV